MDQKQWLGGNFLIAETEMLDPHFAESIVLIVQHNQEGAMGITINSPSVLNLAQACNTVLPEGLSDYPLYLGGPVEREYLLVLHSGFPGGERSPESVLLGTGVVFEPYFPLVSSCWSHYVGHGAMEHFRMRLYSGYAGWSPGQLEEELEARAWLVLPAQAPMVFSAQGHKDWIHALEQLGGVHWAYAKSGYKPSLN